MIHAGLIELPHLVTSRRGQAIGEGIYRAVVSVDQQDPHQRVAVAVRGGSCT
jgi:hypothetical protein